MVRQPGLAIVGGAALLVLAHAGAHAQAAFPARGITPKEITGKVSDAIRQGFQQGHLKARILALEAEPLGSTPDEMRDMIRQSLATWGAVVEAAKIVVD